MPLALTKSDPNPAARQHTAAPTGSTTLNHVRGPSAIDELADMKAERAALVAKVQKLNREIPDAELLQLMATVSE